MTTVQTAATVTEDVVIPVGASFHLDVVWTHDPIDNGDGTTTPGGPVDLTEARALMQVRAKPGAPVLAEVTETGGITLGGPAGTVNVKLTPEQTAALSSVKRAKYDLLVRFPEDDEAYRLVQGNITVDPAISVVAGS